MVKETDKYKPAAFFSKRFPRATVRGSSSASKELLGLLLTLERYKHLVMLSDSVRVVLDCKSVCALIVKSQGVHEFGKPTRWLTKLHSYGPLIYVHHATRDMTQIADSLAHRFNLEGIPESQAKPHLHFAKYSFSKMKKEQLAMDLKEGAEFTLEDLTRKLEKEPEALRVLEPTQKADHWDEAQLENDRCTECEMPPITPTLTPVAPAILEQGLLTDKVEQISDKKHSTELMKKYTSAYFIARQSEDQTCRDILEQIQQLSPTPSHLKRYHILNGVLLTRIKDKNKEAKPENLQIVLPLITAIRLIGDLHILTHGSATTLLKTVRRFYYHQQLKFICSNISLSCETCKRNRLLTKTELPEGQIAMANYPGEILFCDYISMKPSRLHNRTYRYILNIVCGFTNFSFATPVTDMTVNTAKAAFQNLLSFVPQVKTIISDNQSSLLVSTELKDFLAKKGVSSKTVIAYQSKANGLAEVSNKAVRRVLRLFGHAYKKTWTAIFSEAILSLNLLPGSGPHKPKQSAFEQFFGFSPNIPDPLAALKNVTQDHQRLIETIREVRQARQAYHHQRIKAIESRSQIRPGAQVLLLNLFRKDKQSPFYLPENYIVTARRGHFVQVENETTKQLVRTHITRLKLVHELDPFIAASLRPQQRAQLGFEGSIDPTLEGALTTSGGTSTESSSSMTSRSPRSETTQATTRPSDRGTRPASSKSSGEKNINRLPSTKKKKGDEVTPKESTSPPPPKPQVSTPTEQMPKVLDKAKEWLSRTAGSIRNTLRISPLRDDKPTVRRSARLANKAQGLSTPPKVTKVAEAERILPPGDPEEHLQTPAAAPPKRKYEKRFRPLEGQVRRSQRLINQKAAGSIPP